MLTRLCIRGQITRMEYLHSKHIVHRDIKPENFVLGMPPQNNVIFVIDFGLSKRIRDFQRRPETGKAFTGTPRYASINNHLGIGTCLCLCVDATD